MNTIIERIFIKDKEAVMKKTYFWTVMSGLMYSASTFLMLLVTTNLMGAYAGGVFSIALTIGQQLVTVGYFNVRTFQVSDVKGQFGFRDYFTSRILTTAIMFAAGVVWIIAGGYTGEKFLAILLMLLFKMGESLADVMEGLYQQKGRMDVVGRCVFWETFLSVGVFVVTMFFTRNLLWSLMGLTLSYIVLLVVIDGNVVRGFGKISLHWNRARQRGIFFECLPLFVNSFLLMYINNASKYAIDARQSEEALAVFNVIYMPAFVINLLAGFLLKPILNSLAVRYHTGDRKGFSDALKKQACYIAVITAVCIGGAYVLGIPVLSFLYGLDLKEYRLSLCILLLGGGFSAMYQMFQNAIVIMRHQYACLAGCAVTALAAVVLIPFLVKVAGIGGACAGYLFLMALLSGIYFVMTLVFFHKKNSKKREQEEVR